MPNPKDVQRIRQEIDRKIQKEQEAFVKLSPEEKVAFLEKRSERFEATENILKGTLRNGRLDIISTETVNCTHKSDMIYIAFIIIHKDGRKEVRCMGGCSDCVHTG